MSEQDSETDKIPEKFINYGISAYIINNFLENYTQICILFLVGFLVVFLNVGFRQILSKKKNKNII